MMMTHGCMTVEMEMVPLQIEMAMAMAMAATMAMTMEMVPQMVSLHFLLKVRALSIISTTNLGERKCRENCGHFYTCAGDGRRRSSRRQVRATGLDEARIKTTCRGD